MRQVACPDSTVTHRHASFRSECSHIDTRTRGWLSYAATSAVIAWASEVRPELAERSILAFCRFLESTFIKGAPSEIGFESECCKHGNSRLPV